MAVANPLEIVTRAELRSLLEDSRTPALSISHPTERIAVEPEQNSLRLKNLLPEAERRLLEHGLRKPEAQELLEPLRHLLHDGEFWRHQLDGVVFFVAPGFFRHYRLPYRVEETVVVGDRFHTKNLLLALADGHYYILSLSQSSVRFVRATKWGAEEIDLSGLGIPRSIDEALQYDDLQKPEMSHHPSAPERGTLGQRHQFHGHGDVGEEQKTMIRRYFSGVERGLSKLLATENAPLVLVGVQYLHPLYRFASDYRNIAEKGLEGNFDHLTPGELQERTWPLVQPQFYKQLQDAKERFLSLVTRGQGSTDLAAILEAAYAGRVDSLFVLKGEQVWGTFDPTGGGMQVKEEPRKGDVDLIDLACSLSLTREGKVYMCEIADMPVHAKIAALYRF